MTTAPRPHKIFDARQHMKWVRWWTDSSAAKNNVLVAAWSKKGALGQKSRVVFEVPPVLSWMKGQSQREHTLGAGKRRGSRTSVGIRRKFCANHQLEPVDEQVFGQHQVLLGRAALRGCGRLNTCKHTVNTPNQTKTGSEVCVCAPKAHQSCLNAGEVELLASGQI
jgi:hypothetical protein